MFNREKSNGQEKPAATNATLISYGTSVTGDVQSETDLRIDGTVRGNVSTTAKIVVGATGFIEGNILGTQADVSGRVEGNIQVADLAQLRTKSRVEGNITAVSLQIEAGALFNGKSTMTAAANNNKVVQMTEEETVYAQAQ